MKYGLAVCAGFMLLAIAACSPPRPDYPVIGAKNFTEQVVLGELLAQQIEAVTGMKVEALESVGIRVVERISAEVEPLDSFERYVQVKQEKMGHIVDRVPELG